MTKYKVLLGCNFPPDDTRAEPGDVIDVPERIGEALVKAGAAEPVKPPKGESPATSTAPAADEPPPPDDTPEPDPSGTPDDSAPPSDKEVS